MYKNASDSRQRALSNGRLADWANGAEHISDADRLRAMQTEVREIQQRQRTRPYPAEHRRLALRQACLQEQIHQLKPTVMAGKIAGRDIADHFMTIAREQLPPGQFKAMLAAAVRLQNQEIERAKKILNPSNTEITT